MKKLFVNIILFLFVLPAIFAQQKLSANKQVQNSAKSATPLPIIDMHMHARTAAHYGPPPLAICAPVDEMPVWDQRKPIEEAFADNPPCKNMIWSEKTDEELFHKTIEVMQKHNIIGMLGGKPDLVAAWIGKAPGRFIAGLDFRLDRATTTSASKNDSTKYQPMTPDKMRTLYNQGGFAVLGEVLNQYAGIAPDDEQMEPYWALAEELNFPVGIHIGGGGPGEVYFGNNKFRARLQSALTLEEVLVRHPRLRVYIMHAGYPMLDDLLALLFSYPQVYIEVSMAVNVERRESFYRYLKAIMDAGYGKRVMFGSDQMVWPGLIEPAIASINNAPFLSQKQKRDIFYNNAARFLRLSKEDIDRHHGR